IKVAQHRIERIEPPLFSEETFIFENRRSAPRIAFGSLIEQGLIKVGTSLYYARPNRSAAIKLAADGTANTHVAVVRADGSLKSGELVGSIHSVGAKVAGLPACNGWDHWYFLDEQGNLRVINELREEVRQRNTSLTKIMPPLQELVLSS
ncbi:MAG: hypothetical protein WCS37_08725, partial [Chloroflexota bacterium]